MDFLMVDSCWTEWTKVDSMDGDGHEKQIWRLRVGDQRADIGI
jgi:hypothetical protein